MSKRRKKPQRKPRRHIIESTHSEGVPGLYGEFAEAGTDMLLVSEFNSNSGAVHHPADDTFTPVVFVNIKGRWNRTDMLADLNLIVPPDAATDWAKGLAGAAERAPLDVEWNQR